MLMLMNGVIWGMAFSESHEWYPASYTWGQTSNVLDSSFGVSVYMQTHILLISLFHFFLNSSNPASFATSFKPCKSYICPENVCGKCYWPMSQKCANHWFRLPKMTGFFNVELPIPILQISQLEDLNSHNKLVSEPELELHHLISRLLSLPVPALPFHIERGTEENFPWPHCITSSYHALFISCLVLSSGTKRTAKIPVGNYNDKVPYLTIVNPVGVEAGNKMVTWSFCWLAQCWVRRIAYSEH